MPNFLRNTAQILHKKFNLVYDSFSAKSVTCSIGDILLLRSEMCINDYLVAARVQDVLEYRKGNTEFLYQTAVTRASNPNISDFEIEKHNKSFISLINSYDVVGYDETSTFLVDKNFKLMDGTHRCALNYLYGFEKIVVDRTVRNPFQYDGDFFFREKLQSDMINKIEQTVRDMQKELINRGDTFLCVTNSENSEKLIQSCGSVLTKRKIHLDDSEPIFETLLLHAGEYFLIQFSLDYPRYVIEETLASLTIKEFIEHANNSLGFTYFSKSCLEGYLVFSHLKNYISR